MKYIRAVGSNLFVCAGWTVLLVVLHCIPGNSIPKSDFFEFKFLDKFLHFAMFGSFIFFWTIYQMNRPTASLSLKGALLRIIIIGVGLGLLLEWIQGSFIPLRSFETGDLLVDAAGLLAVAYLLWKYGARTGLFHQ